MNNTATRTKMSTLSTRLKSYRVQKRLTMKQVASAINVPVTTYREWEYGRIIRGEPYVALAKVFEITVYELLTGVKSDKRTVTQEIIAIKTHIAILEGQLESLFSV